MERIAFGNVADFIAACVARHVRGAAMHVVDEIRPRWRDDGRVEVGPQKYVELFAYDRGTVLAALVRDMPPGAIEAALTSAGLQVRRRSGNVG
jgi:hypothetical protein